MLVSARAARAMVATIGRAGMPALAALGRHRPAGAARWLLVGASLAQVIALTGVGITGVLVLARMRWAGALHGRPIAAPAGPIEAHAAGLAGARRRMRHSGLAISAVGVVRAVGAHGGTHRALAVLALGRRAVPGGRPGLPRWSRRASALAMDRLGRREVIGKGAIRYGNWWRSGVGTLCRPGQSSILT
jgi:hypothetical protein